MDSSEPEEEALMRGQLQMAAMDGQYLRPFAKVLLALVARREDQPELARKLLEELSAEFPANPLFRRELVLLKEKAATGGNE